jgi:hypothetical protein
MIDKFLFSWEGIKKSSDIWDEFWEAVDPTCGLAYLVCSYCGYYAMHPSHDTGRSTSKFSRHLEKCDKYKATKGKTPTQVEREEFWSLRSTMSNDRLKDHVLRIITAGDLPFSFAENPEFVRFVKISYPNLDPPTRESVAEHLSKQASAAKEKLKDYFGAFNGKVSLALDGWNSRNNKDFLGTFP